MDKDDSSGTPDALHALLIQDLARFLTDPNAEGTSRLPEHAGAPELLESIPRREQQPARLTRCHHTEAAAQCLARDDGREVSGRAVTARGIVEVLDVARPWLG